MHDILLSFLLGSAVAGPVGYFGKRFVEKARTDEEIARVSELVEIKRKLDEGRLTMSDIVELRSEIMRQSVEKDVNGEEEEPARQIEGGVEDGTIDVESRARANVMTELNAGDLPDFENGPQQTMNRGQAERLERANAILRRTLDRLREALHGDDDSLAQLERSQRAWQRFRDQDAQFSSMIFNGGTMQPFLRSGSATSLTIDRIVALRLELWNRGERV